MPKRSLINGVFALAIFQFVSCQMSSKDIIGNYYKENSKGYSFVINIHSENVYDVHFKDQSSEISFNGEWKLIDNELYLSKWFFLDSVYVPPLCNCTSYNTFLRKDRGNLKINFQIDDDSYSFIRMHR